MAFDAATRPVGLRGVAIAITPGWLGATVTRLAGTTCTGSNMSLGTTSGSFTRI